MSVQFRRVIGFILCGVVAGFHLPPASAQDLPPTPVAEQDSLALVELFRVTNGPNWTLNRGWLEDVVAHWFGVTVAGGRVVNLSLVSNHLVGQIPTLIGDLTALETLNLRDNQLTGAIPPSIGRLSRLYLLWLDGNELSGAIPSNLGNLSGMQELDLSRNKLSGQLPEQLAGQEGLVTLDVSVNDLNGPIPASFTRLRSLYEFHFSGTAICEPPDEAMQEWLRSIEIVSSSGIVCEGDENSPPSCSFSRPSPMAAIEGQPISFEVIATDADNEAIQLLDLELPTGAVMIPPLPRTGPPPLTSTFSWTPSATGTFFARFHVADAVTSETCSARIVVGEGQAVLEASATALEFGSVIVGGARDLDVWLFNRGNAALSISAITISGDGAGAFSVSYSGAAIASMDSARARLLFRPLSEGSYEAVVDISSSGGALSIALSGTGINADVLQLVLAEVTPVDTPVLSRGESVTYAIVVADLEGERVPGANVVVHDGLRDAAEELVPTDQNGRTTYEVSIPADAAGGRYALTFSATKEGYQGSEAVTRHVDVVLSRAELVSEDSLHFGAVEIGVSENLTLWIRNVGTAPASISGVSISGRGADAFSFTFPLDPVQPQDSVRIDVHFSPALAGEHDAVAAVSTSGGSLFVRLMGLGTGDEVSLAPAQLDFGEVIVGEEAQIPLVLTNRSLDPIAIIDISITGPGASEFSAAPEQAVIASGEEASIDVAFAPSAGGLRMATVMIDTDRGVHEVGVQGRGVSSVAVSVEVQVEPPVAGSAITIDMNVVGEGRFDPSIALVAYRRGGEVIFWFTDFVVDGASGTASIPAEFVTDRGVECYFLFSDGLTTITIPESAPEENPILLAVSVDQAVVPFFAAPVVYQMVSVPLVLEQREAAAVFGDYGSYDPSRWRLLRWNSTRERYDELPDLNTTVEPGTAFWLITNDGGTFNVRNAVSTYQGASTAREIELPPGWSQIGNPFSFPVSWSGVNSTGSVQAPVFVSHDAELGSYREQYNVRVLVPWRGYWVRNNEAVPVTLSVNPVAADVEAFKSISDGAEPSSLVPEGAYALQLIAEIPDLRLSDPNTFVGFFQGVEIDQTLRTSKAPPIGEHVRLFIHEGGERLAASYRRLDEAGQFWDLNLYSSSSSSALSKSRTVRVRLHEHGRRPDGFELYVVDLDRDRPLALDGGAFDVELDRHHSAASLRVVIGTEAFAEQNSEGIPLTPVAFALEQNYPNPFNPSTEIRFATAERTPVQIQVFNVLGQVVRTLVDSEFPSGVHQVTWDGRNDQGVAVSSGAYVYRMRAGAFRQSRTLLLIR